MKIRINKKPSGIVLVVALFIIVAVGIVLASYLSLMQNESASVSRSQNWNQGVPVMEAGVEEAFAQIHYCNNTTNLSSNNWTLQTNGYYQKTRTVGTDGSYCVINIQPTTSPVIYATAYVPLGAYNTNYIVREVRVTTTNQSASGGLQAKGAITMSGNARLDSYNSAVAPYNSSAPGTNAIALTDSTAAGAISLAGSSKIYGMAVTGPGATIVFGGTSTVGDSSWNSGGNVGTEHGWSANDANVQFNDIVLPPGVATWTTPLLPGKVSGTNYTYLLTAGNFYQTAQLSITGIQNMAVVGTVNLYLAGGLAIANSGFIYIAPNSSLTIYTGGTVNLNGAGIANGTGSTACLTIYGLPTCTNITYANGGAFVGTVNAPEAALAVNGAGGAFGQYTANTITIGNSGAVHFDQALGANSGVIAASWNEIQ